MRTYKPEVSHRTLSVDQTFPLLYFHPCLKFLLKAIMALSCIPVIIRYALLSLKVTIGVSNSDFDAILPLYKDFIESSPSTLKTNDVELRDSLCWDDSLSEGNPSINLLCPSHSDMTAMT